MKSIFRSIRTIRSISLISLIGLFFLFSANFSPALATDVIFKDSFTKRSGTGPQTETGIPFRPAAIIFTWSLQTATGEGPNTGSFGGVGMATDSTHERALSWWDEDQAANGAADTGVATYDTASIVFQTDDGATTPGIADFTEFTSDGFTLNWSTSDTSAYIIHYTAFSNVYFTNATVNTFSLTTGTGPLSITSAGFQPNFAFFLTGATTTHNANTADLRYAIGAASGSTDEWTIAGRSTDTPDSTDSCSIQRTDATISMIVPTGTSACDNLDALADFTQFTSTGFDINKSDGPAGAFDVFYLALQTNLTFEVSSFNKPTTAQSQTTTVGFQPAGVFFASSGNIASTSVVADSDLMIGAASSAGVEGALARSSVDADDASEPRTYSATDKAVAIIETDSATLTAAADLTAYTSTGFTLNWTTADGTADEILYWAVSDANTFTGIAYTDEGSTLDTSASICVAVNAGTPGCDATDGSGVFLIAMPLTTSGDQLTFFFDGGSEFGNTVTVSDAGNIVSGDNLKVFQGHVIVRYETGSNIIITQMDAYDNDQNSTDILFDAEDAATDTLTVEDTYELYIPSGFTFAPGGNLDNGAGVGIDDIKIVGTYTAASGQSILVSGTWLNSGIFTSSTSTVTFDSTTSETLNNTGATTHDLYNLVTSSTVSLTLTTTTNATGDVTIGSGTTLTNSGTFTVTGDVAANGTLTVGSTMTINGGALTTGASGSVGYSGTPTLSLNGTGTLGGNSRTLTFYTLDLGDDTTDETTAGTSTFVVDNNLIVSANQTFTLGGNSITVGSNSVTDSGSLTVNTGGLYTQTSSGSTTIKSSDNSTAPTITLTASSYFYNLNIGTTTDNTTYTVDLGSAIDINNDLTITDAGVSDTHTFSPGSYQVNIGNAYTNSDIFTAGSGTVVMDAADGTGNTLAGTMTGGSAFNNLTFNNSGGSWSFSAAATIGGNFTITAATAVTAPSATLTVTGNFTGNSAFTHNSGTVSLNGAGGSTQTLAGSTTFFTLSATTASTRTIAITAGTTQTIAASGDFTLTGTDCNSLLMLRSTSASTYTITDNAGGTTTLSYLDVQNSVASPALSASNSVDSGGNTSWTITGSCTGGSSSALATGYSFQRKTFLDPTNSRHWMFYYDGTGIVAKYSSNSGTSWNSATGLSYATNDFSVWTSAISGTQYVFLAVASGNDVILRRGTLAASSVTWDSACDTTCVIAFDGTGASDTYANVFISADSSYRLWTMARYYSGTSYVVKVIDSVNVGNTTWTAAAFTFNTAASISNAQANSNVYGNIVPLASADMYATYAVGTQLLGCLWDDSGAAWLNADSDGCTGATTSYYFNAASADNQTTSATAARKSASTTLGTSTQTFTLDGTNTTMYILTDVSNKKYTNDKTATTNTTGEKRNIDIATDPQGNTVAVWEDNRNSSGTNDKFTFVSNALGTRRADHVTTVLVSGKILVVGGGNGSSLSSAEVYDPITKTSIPVSNNLTGLRYEGHGVTLLNNGKVLVSGSRQNGPASTAELYDPTTNTFAITTNNLNTGRWSHGVVLLNNGQVLLAGGATSIGTELSTAELYDPATNTFTYTTNSLSGARAEVSATLLNNGKVLITGGNDGSSSVSIAELYDPVTKTFAPTGFLIGRRYGHSAIPLNNGNVLIAGGLISGSNYLSTAELYDPATGTFTSTRGNLTDMRYLHTASILNNGKVLIAGSYIGTAVLSTSEIYDPSSNTFTATTGMLQVAREKLTSVLLNSGQIVVMGGWDGSAAYFSSAELYTPNTYDIYAQKYNSSGTALWNGGTDIKVNSDDGNRTTQSGNPSNYDHLNPKVKLDGASNPIITWQESRNSVYGDDIYAQKLQHSDGAKLWPTSSSSTDKFTSTTNNLSVVRESLTSTPLNNGKILVAGGHDGTNNLSSAELYDPTGNTFSNLTTGRLLGLRSKHTATLLNNGKVLVTGGTNGSAVTTAELFDPVANTFASTTGGLVGLRYDHSATLLNNGKVLVTGGTNGSAVTTAELFDPVANTFASTTGGLVGLRYDHSATLLNNGKILVTGGHDGTNNLSSAELYDPTGNTFSNLTSGRLIGRRYLHTTNLLNTGKVLVTGGTGSSQLSTAELFTPAIDIEVSNDGSPTNGLGIPRPEHPEMGGGVLAEQRQPTIAVDSSDNALIAWESNHLGVISQWENVSNVNGTPNKTSISGSPLRVMGQKLTSTTGAKNWGNSQAGVNQNNPEDIILSATGDSNRNPKIIASGTNAIVTWESNAANGSGSQWRESNIYTQKFDTNGLPSFNGTFTNLTNNIMTGRRNIHTATLLNNGKVLIAAGFNDTSISTAELYNPDTNAFTNLPTGLLIGRRTNFTATSLTNGKVLVTGGSNGSAITTAELFDPSTNTFALTTGGLTGSRTSHTATLLNNAKVLIAGGTSSGAISTAELYDPSANTFSNLTTGRLIGQRNIHTATLLNNGKVLIAGGTSGGAALSTAELFDPSTNTFALTTGGLTGSRGDHTATLLNNGKVLIAGGTSGGDALSTTELYDPSTNNFSNLTAGRLIGHRNKHTATLLNNGKVLIAGGFDETNALSSAEIYDPTTNTFLDITTGRLTESRSALTATLLTNGKVLLAGGTNGNTLSTAELYSPNQMVNSGVDLAEQTNPDVATSGASLVFTWSGMRGSGPGSGGTNGDSDRGGGSWKIYGQKTDNPSSGSLAQQWPTGTTDTFTSTTGKLIGMRDTHASSLLSSGKVLITGGFDQTDALSSAELYDPSTNTFTNTTGKLIGMRHDQTSTSLNNGKILIAGGATGVSTALSTTELYDPATGTFTTSSTSNIINRRYQHTATLLNSGNVLIAGGNTANSSAEIYNPTTDTFSVATGILIGERYHHSATLLNTGKVLIAGGTTGASFFSTSELYDPSTGTFTSLATTRLIGSRARHTATLLNDGEVLIAGGFSGGTEYLSTAELYNPSTGTFRVTTGKLIGARYYHSSTLLNNGKVLIVGGSDGTSAISTAELYNPSTGTFTATTNMLIGERITHTSTLLTSGKVLITGGDDSGNSISTAETYNPSGELMLSHDLAIKGDHTKPAIVMDSGNPIIAWADTRSAPGNTITTDSNIYMQKFDLSTGAPQWPAASTTSPYTSPYSVSDIRVDTTRGSTGTHYSGRPVIGMSGTLGDSTKRVLIAWEDSRYNASAASGECGISNSTSLVRVCMQSYDTVEQNNEQNVDWSVYFHASSPSTPTISVDTATTESDGFLAAAYATAQSWTTCSPACPSLQGLTFTAPPSDTVGNISFRRRGARFTRSAGSVTISYDNSTEPSRLDVGTLGLQDTIDSAITSGLTNTLSATVDTTNYDVHLAYVDDQSPDEVVYKRWDNGTVTWDSTPVTLVSSANASNPTISLDTSTQDLTAFYINSGVIYYRTCDVSAAGASQCSEVADWASATSWQTGTNTYVTSSYAANCQAMALWSIGTGPVTIDWDYITTGSGTTLTQNDFAWYVTAASTTLSNLWPPGGGEDIGENTALTQLPASNEALKNEDKVRIQSNFTVASCDSGLAATSQRFQLQYAAGEDCTIASGWTAVGAKDSGVIWRLYDETGIGDSTVQVNQLASSTAGAEGYYSEINYSAVNPNAVTNGQSSEWDWPIQNNGATPNTTYCFRMVKHDGVSTATPLDSYSADSYPQLTTAPDSSDLMRHGRFFQNDTLRGFFWAD